MGRPISETNDNCMPMAIVWHTTINNNNELLQRANSLPETKEQWLSYIESEVNAGAVLCANGSSFLYRLFMKKFLANPACMQHCSRNDVELTILRMIYVQERYLDCDWATHAIGPMIAPFETTEYNRISAENDDYFQDDE